MKKALLFVALWPCLLQAQFHTLKMPEASPAVKETQVLGVTDISVEYHSPAVKGRKIWGNVVPMDGDPIPWRAGANMNTRISFSTPVEIEGKALEAGSYGFHAVPGEKSWELLFAENDNMWGSYYLDPDKDVALMVEVSPEPVSFREYLSYEFRARTDTSIVIAIEWDTLRVPFKIKIDLTKTVIESLAYQLEGVNTNTWASYYAAARWCLEHNTHLEQGLTWVDRSIAGGYGGFRADKNFDNLSTKALILWRLDRGEEADSLINEAIPLSKDPGAMYYLGMDLLGMQKYSESLNVYQQACNRYEDQWYLFLGLARAWSGKENYQAASDALDKALSLGPDSYQGYLQGLKTKLENKESIMR